MSFANSVFFAFVNFQTFNFQQRLREQLALMVILRQMQNIASGLVRQPCRHHQQVGAQSFQCCMQILWRPLFFWRRVARPGFHAQRCQQAQGHAIAEAFFPEQQQQPLAHVLRAVNMDVYDHFCILQLVKFPFSV